MQSVTTPSPPADAVVLTLRKGAALTHWRRKGAIERERLWLEALAEVYQQVILVTHGDGEDYHIAETMLSNERITVAPAGVTRTQTPRHVDRLLHSSARRVIVQSVHADDGGIGPAIANALRAAGRDVAFVLRCSYLPSRRVAATGAPHSHDAVVAGEVERTAVADADLVIGVSRSIIEDLTWRYALDPARTRVIPNFTPVAKEAPIIDAGDRSRADLIAIGGINPSQRHDLLIDAVGSLDRDLRDEAVLTIIGEGPDTRAIQRQAEDANVRVETLSKIGYQELLERLGRATVLLHAAPVGPQPRPVLEAMAVGTPVIANFAGAPIELLSNGVTGLTVPEDPDAFANAMVGLLPDTDWRRMIGASAARCVRDKCGLDRVRRLTLDAHGAAFELRDARHAA